MSTEVYTTKEAAFMLGVTESRVRQLVGDGVIEAQRFGRALVISSEALKAARERKTKPGPTPKTKAA